MGHWKGVWLAMRHWVCVLESNVTSAYGSPSQKGGASGQNSTWLLWWYVCPWEENGCLRYLDLSRLSSDHRATSLCAYSKPIKLPPVGYLACHGSPYRRIRYSPSSVSTTYTYLSHCQPVIGILIRHSLKNCAHVSLSLEPSLITGIAKLGSWAWKQRITPDAMASPWSNCSLLGPLKSASVLSLWCTSASGTLHMYSFKLPHLWYEVFYDPSRKSQQMCLSTPVWSLQYSKLQFSVRDEHGNTMYSHGYILVFILTRVPPFARQKRSIKSEIAKLEVWNLSLSEYVKCRDTNLLKGTNSLLEQFLADRPCVRGTQRNPSCLLFGWTPLVF